MTRILLFFPMVCCWGIKTTVFIKNMYQRPELERYNQMLRPAVQYIQSVKASLSTNDFNEFLLLCRDYITQSYVK